MATDGSLTSDLSLRFPRRLQSPKHILRAERQRSDSHAGGVEDRVSDGSHRRDAGDFAGAFGAVGAGAGVAMDQRRFDARHHVDRRHQVIDEGRIHWLSLRFTKYVAFTTNECSLSNRKTLRLNPKMALRGCRWLTEIVVPTSHRFEHCNAANPPAS